MHQPSRIPPRRAPERRLLTFVISAIAVLVATAALPGCKKKEAPPPPPPSVKAATVLQKDVPIYLEAIGQTRGSTEIEIRARVEGFLQSVNFKEGSVVKKGDLLYTIDKQPLEATLAQAKARLAQADAQLARAHQDTARLAPLVAKNAVSRQEYETAVVLEQAAKAQVEAQKAVVESATLDLGYANVVAPEDGLVGKTEVNPGALVGRGESTLLTHISKVDPIHVRFTLPEKDYLVLAKRREASGVASDAPYKAILELLLADGSVLPSKGSLVFVDRNVDPQTGTILMEAAYPNPTGIVRPGQYGRVRAAVETKKGAILVPQRAVQEMQGVFNVAVVKSDDTIEFRMVTPAERIGSLWVIDSGLKSGERIVVEGLQKVRPEVKVTAENVTIDESGKAPAAEPPPAAPDEKKKS